MQRATLPTGRTLQEPQEAWWAQLYPFHMKMLPLRAGKQTPPTGRKRLQCCIPSPHEIVTAICRRYERRPTDVSEVERKRTWKGHKIIWKEYNCSKRRKAHIIDKDQTEMVDVRSPSRFDFYR